MKAWQCTVCNYIHKEDTPPEKCPVCGVGRDKFVEIEIDEEPAPPPPPRSTPKEAPPLEARGPYERLTQLLIRHHAHPVLVHTPNGLLPVSLFLFILAWLFGSATLATAGMINLIFVVLSLPLVIYTVLLEWDKKYMKADSLPFKIKILAAALTSAASLISLIWLALDSHVLFGPRAWAFMLINLTMVGAAGVAGHIGGKLVFKD